MQHWYCFVWVKNSYFHVLCIITHTDHKHIRHDAQKRHYLFPKPNSKHLVRQSAPVQEPYFILLILLELNKVKPFLVTANHICSRAIPVPMGRWKMLRGENGHNMCMHTVTTWWIRSHHQSFMSINGFRNRPCNNLLSCHIHINLCASEIHIYE